MNRVLNGARILVTRPAHQAQNLAHLLQQHGATVVLLPTIAIAQVDDLHSIRNTLENLHRFQSLIFISANAVNFALEANGGKIADTSKLLHFVAVGKATAQAMAAAGITVNLVPEQGFNSEALLAMPQLKQVDGQRILIVRGVGGRDELANTLRARGAQVDYLEVYRRVIPCIDSAPVVKLLMQNKLDVITAASVEALRNLLSMLGKSNHALLFNLPLIVVSDRIKNVAAELGFKRITVTEMPSDTAILDTVTTHVVRK